MKKYILSLICVLIAVVSNAQNVESTNFGRNIYKQATTSWSDTLIKSDFLNFAVLIVDYDTHVFEGGNLSYYQHCINCTKDSIPFEIFVVYPGDFGSIAYNIQNTSETVYNATIIWMGTGQIYHPEEFISSYPFNTIGNVVEKPEHIEYYNIYGSKVYTDSTFIQAADSAWHKIESLEITRLFSEYNYKAGIYLYPPTVGLFSPAAAKWIIFLYLNDFNASVQPPAAINYNQLSIFPNPCRDFLTIDLSSFKRDDCMLEIMDLSGRSILRQPIHLSVHEKIDVRALERGSYVLKIHNSGIQYVSLFVKN